MSAPLDHLLASCTRPVTAVLFDWGGTLAQYLGDTPRDCLFRAALDVLPPASSARFGESIAERIKKSWGSGPMVSDTIESLVRSTIADLSVVVEGIDVATTFVDRYLTLLEEKVKHSPDAKNLLRQLNHRGLQTAMVCNTLWPARWHDQLLARDGLLESLPIRTYSSVTHIRKPHPEAFNAVARQLHVDPRACVFIGDRGDEDIDGAAAAGMATIWVSNNYSPPRLHQPDLVVAGSIGELVGGETQ